MQLKKLNYRQYKNTDNEWNLIDLSFEKVNLIVGKNSTGKTRLLNVISNIGNYLAGLQVIPGNMETEIEFNDKRKTIVLSVIADNSVILKEKLTISGKPIYERNKDGEGTIRAEEINKKIKFKVPEKNALACFAKRDDIQHPFLEPLFNWGNTLRYIKFGSDLGQNHILVEDKNRPKTDPNIKDSHLTYQFFFNGIKIDPVNFKKNVVADVNSLGYKISDIFIDSFNEIEVGSNISLPSMPQGLYVTEEDHLHKVRFYELSQGLFRAISLFTQLRYAQLVSIPNLILIDDIGEGLDFDRSTLLIKRVFSIVSESQIQIIMSSNDRFTMNAIPLKYWHVMVREGSSCKSYNYANSKQIFEDFEFTGLNNFDFFTSNYFLK